MNIKIKALLTFSLGLNLILGFMAVNRWREDQYTLNQNYHEFRHNLALYSSQINMSIETNNSAYLRGNGYLKNMYRDLSVFNKYDEKVGKRISSNIILIMDYFSFANPDKEELIEYNNNLKRLIKALPDKQMNSVSLGEIFKSKLTKQELSYIKSVSEEIYKRYTPPLPKRVEK